GPYVGAILAGPALFVGGYLLHSFLISRVTGTHVIGSESDGHYSQLVLTLGVALILENGALILFGSTPQSVRTPLSSRAWEVPLLYDPFAAVFLNKASVVASVISIIVGASLYFLINRSRLGKTLRAAADNPVAALYMGIDVDRAHRLAFGIGTGVTAIAGGLVATYHPFQPYVGFEFVIIMYAGVVMGGMGSILGAFWGGMTIGLVQQLSTLVLPVQLQNAAIFAVFLMVVLLRPQGLFGRATERV
ncbi:MAG TPA: branched-chain amino acid ABC transporter permease, partial [Stellaceae bacterium]